MSKNLVKNISLINIFVPFDHSIKFIKDLIGFNISKRIIQQASYEIGEVLSAYHQEKLLPAEKIKLLKEVKKSKGPDVQYFMTDGGQTPLLEKIEDLTDDEKTTLKPSKKRAKNTKRYRETKVGLFFTSDDVVKTKSRNNLDRFEIKNKRFVVSLKHGLKHFENAVCKANQLHKVSRSKIIVYISDGSEWCKTIKDNVFPTAIRILDYYHANEHLWEAAIKFFGDSNKNEFTKWAKPLEELLWNGEIDKLLSMIDDTISVTKKDQTPLRNLFKYYDKNRDAMQYKKFRDLDYFIGSGSMESAIKYILTTRLKQTGCHWRHKSAEAMIWLRSKFFEDRWDQFWDNMKYSEFLKGHNLYSLVS